MNLSSNGNNSYIDEMNVERYINREQLIKVKQIPDSKVFTQSIVDRIRDLNLTCKHPYIRELTDRSKRLSDTISIHKQTVDSTYYILIEYASGKMFLGYVFIEPGLEEHHVKIYMQPVENRKSSFIKGKLPLPTKEGRRANPLYTTFRSMTHFFEGLDSGEFKVHRIGRQSRIPIHEVISVKQLIDTDLPSYRETKLRQLYGGK